MPPPWSRGDYRESEEVHSRASDAGSVKSDSVSEHSTATMDTSMSAGTLASGASTSLISQQVHFFSLDDFAGHEIETILEDGENEVINADAHADDTDRGSAGNQSVRPGSIVSNIEQRLDEIEGFQGDGQGEAERGRGRGHGEAEDGMEDAGPSAAASSSACSSTAAASAAAAEAQYMRLLQQMQHRELTPSDLQLLALLDQQRVNSNLPSSTARARLAATSAAASAAGPSGAYF
jgi:hypothetical protein